MNIPLPAPLSKTLEEGVMGRREVDILSNSRQGARVMSWIEEAHLEEWSAKVVVSWMDGRI